jgi:uncharacterized protein
MVSRLKQEEIFSALKSRPVVVLLGARQVGKTTLALEVAANIDKKVTYLDLELDSDFVKLSNPQEYLSRFSNELLIIDEAQLKPDLFPLIRSLVDKRKQKGEKAGHFLLLGSASKDIIQHSSESLAGRIRFIELHPFQLLEINSSGDENALEKFWFRGGFPDSFLAENDKESWQWRSDFISTYVERDIPVLGVGISPIRLKRFWTMLAHYHGQQVIYSELARSLEVSHTTIKNYLDVLTDFYMIRQLPPWSGNLKKRLVKSSKIYIRDTGLLHRLLNISNFEQLYSHPVIGASWEGLVVESIINLLDDRWQFFYFRTQTQNEIDLVLNTPNNEIWAIEIKRAATPQLKRGFFEACQDIKAARKWVVTAGDDQFPLKNNVEVIGLMKFLKIIAEI